MTSKQEKLAAARRKLKEFQGKNKEAEILKQKNISDTTTPKISKDHSSDAVIRSSPLISEVDNSKSSPLGAQSYYLTQPVVGQTKEDISNERKLSQSSLNGTNPAIQHNFFSDYHNQIDNFCNNTSDFPGGRSDCANGLRPDVESQNVDERNGLGIKSFPSGKSSSEITSKEHGSSDTVSSFNDVTKSMSVEAKEFYNNDGSNKSLNDVIRPLQMELENHAKTITILVQQRNDAQTALAKAQSLANEKSGEVNELKQQIGNLMSSTKNLSQRLADAESVIMKLKLEKEDNLQKQDEIKSLADKFKAQLDEKEEEFQEMRRKHEEKNSDCQRLLFSLQEAQSQLSIYQIQLQQYSAEGHSGLAARLSEIQNENLNLNQRILELEKKLETEKVEKEESSQKFHIYAQQCNSQLSFLNSQLKSLQVENENLSQENKVLCENLSDLESTKEKAPSSESFESEIANLHNQLSALSEENNLVKCNLKKKEEECTEMEKKLDEKELDLNRLLVELKELEEENKKLANEAETPKASERLLATMESDKVAAAKAVSQNQKLKEQVVELEKAFVKISEEKLELTNQLAHEKHVNSELKNIMNNAEWNHHDGDHVHGHDCHHEEESESLVNDSNEVEELRNIVRQLQDDKMELTARLNSYESNKGSLQEEREKQNAHEHEEVECENTKLLLQQMEEKVKKTMNELAVLDEEKEKLEHLVLQLQGETETIGEYITLYQKQRMILRQRAQEKDIQLLQLSKDKEELKSKLVALDELVQALIAERENANVQSVSKLPAVNAVSEVPENTAGKIRALINEIGSTTLINNHTFAFEHCSCCSGRLMTI